MFLVTTRTIQGRFLLRPSKALNALAVGVIARAQRRYGVEIHAIVVLSNHYHLLLSVGSAWQLASFMNFVNGNLAREAGRLYGWRDRFWSRRYQATLVSQEPQAQIDRLRYILAHGSKEGLVTKPGEWPGVQCARALSSGEPLEGHWINRTRWFQARTTEASESDFAERETLELTPLPCWDHLSEHAQLERVRDLLDAIETEFMPVGSSRRKPLGTKRILRQHPHQRPRHSKRSPAPRFHCFTREMRRILSDAYRSFLLAYRSAAQRLRLGHRDVEFPAGCYPPALPFVQLEPRPG